MVSTVYNGEAYVDRAIPGILAQTYDDFEFIIVDDGSQDRTPQLLRELAARDSRVRICSPGRIGAAVAYNYAVTQARGVYIARQDFDDRRLRQWAPTSGLLPRCPSRSRRGRWSLRVGR